MIRKCKINIGGFGGEFVTKYVIGYFLICLLSFISNNFNFIGLYVLNNVTLGIQGCN